MRNILMVALLLVLSAIPRMRCRLLECDDVMTSSCCVPGHYNLSLAESNATSVPRTVLPGIDVLEIHNNTEFPWARCGHSALLEARFQPTVDETGSCSRCVKVPMCGRRMLKIEIDFDPASSFRDWVLEIADINELGNFDARLIYFRGSFFVVKGMACDRHPLPLFSPRMGLQGVSRLTLLLSHQRVELRSDRGHHWAKCSRCSFNLNFPAASPGREGRDPVLHIAVSRAVERPISYTTRGRGVCSVRLEWVCPWCNQPSLWETYSRRRVVWP